MNHVVGKSFNRYCATHVIVKHHIVGVKIDFTFLKTNVVGGTAGCAGMFVTVLVSHWKLVPKLLCWRPMDLNNQVRKFEQTTKQTMCDTVCPGLCWRRFQCTHGSNISLVCSCGSAI